MRRAGHLQLAMLVCAVCLAGCSKKEPPPPPPPRTARIPSPTLPELMLVVRRSDVVVAAEVVSVDPTTRKTSGPCNAQDVAYTVATVLYGAANTGRVSVPHAVCVDRPFVDHKTVALSPEHVHPGARFILFLRREGGNNVFADDRSGILPDTPEVRAELQKAIANVTGSKAPGKQDPFNR
jgi:hypothetical protein